MEDRMVQFIAGLRAAGVRISLAESQDCMLAVLHLGATNRALFRSGLRATLVKEHTDQPIFDKLFPLYFGSGGPPFVPPDEALSPDDQQMLEAALRALAGELNKLMQMLARGQQPSEGEMERFARLAGADRAQRPEQQPWLTREMLRRMGLEALAEQIEKLLEQLAQMGMTPEGQRAVLEMLAQNKDALQEQASQFVGDTIARKLSEQQPQKMDGHDLMQRPFSDLTQAEARELRQQVGRLAARLRTRAALRQRKGDGRKLDVKSTLRANLHMGGVPFELHYKKRVLKPKFALICDISTSMRPVAEFMLRLMYEMQDHVGKARSFAFNDHLEEVSDEFIGQRPDVAIPEVLQRIPPGYYATDLGRGLSDFCTLHLDAVDGRTTVIFLGDGRNNYNNPRLELFERIRRRARRVVWFNPEERALWGTGDSDIHHYAALCDAVHQVSNLALLADAVDKLFSTR